MRKYIEVRYRQPMVISLNNYLGAVIYSYLELPNSSNRLKANSAIIAGRYRLLTDYIRILIPRHQVHRANIGLCIPYANAVLVNNLFEEKIAEDMHTYCKSYGMCSKTQHQAIEDFCTHHNIDIDIDITYTALRKAEYRHKKKIEKSPPYLSPRFFAHTF